MKQLIFSRYVATELIKRGNNLLYTQENKKKKGYLVYIFEKTNKLMKDLTDITQEIKNN